MSRRVVITGMGLLTPCGTGVQKSWDAVVAGRSGIAPITLFDAGALDVRFAGEVKDFSVDDYMDRKESRRMDRFQHFAVAASDMALADAGLRVTPANAERTGVIIGSGIGGLASWEETHRKALERGPGRISPFFILQMIANLAPGQVSMRHGIRGPNWSTNSACSTSAHAIGEAMRAIQRGDVDAMLAGGTEAPVTMLGVGGFAAMKALSTRNAEPERASRPFDAGRDGFVLAEGAGVLVLEALEHATDRGARIYAEVAGYGSSSDAHHVTAPLPEHEGAQRAMRLALADARLAPADVGYVNAHGTSTPVGDVLEAQAVQRVWGEHAGRVAMSSTKSVTGHTNGAAGAVEAAICALALRDGILPPTMNLDEQDAEIAIDCVPNVARRADIHAALSNSFGFGGTNVSLVLTRFQA